MDGRDVDRLLWAVAEARRLRTEERTDHPAGSRAWGSDAVRAETQFATDWQQPSRAAS